MDIEKRKYRSGYHVSGIKSQKQIQSSRQLSGIQDIAWAEDQFLLNISKPMAALSLNDIPESFVKDEKTEYQEHTLIKRQKAQAVHYKHPPVDAVTYTGFWAFKASPPDPLRDDSRSYFDSYALFGFALAVLGGFVYLISAPAGNFLLALLSPLITYLGIKGLVRTLDKRRNLRGWYFALVAAVVGLYFIYYGIWYLTVHL